MIDWRTAEGNRAPAILVTAVLIFWVWVFHASMIQIGMFSHYDEFHTLDRSTAFARQGDWWNVYTAGAVTFNKPPLQYWAGAWLLEQGVDLVTALRVPSVIFALGCLVMTAILAAQIVPASPWVMPASALLLSSSSRFWKAGISAMLDSGALFFVLVALAATIAALRRPGWWYVTALAIGIGTWQKAPIALVFIAVFLLFLGLTARWHGIRFSAFLRNRHFRLSLALALLVAASWHGYQFAKHGSIAIESGIGEQMVGRFAPSASGHAERDLAQVLKHVQGGEPVLRILGLFALVLLPWRLKRFVLLPLPMMTLSYFVVVIFASGYVSTRYIVYFTPLLAIALSAVILTQRWSDWSKGAALVAASLLTGGPVKPPQEISLLGNRMRLVQIELLSSLDDLRKPQDALVFCNWSRDKRIPPGAISYFGTDGERFTTLRRDYQFEQLLTEGEIGGSLAGICAREHLTVLEPYLEGLEIGQSESEFVQWRADGVRLPDAR